MSSGERGIRAHLSEAQRLAAEMASVLIELQAAIDYIDGRCSGGQPIADLVDETLLTRLRESARRNKGNNWREQQGDVK